MENASKALEMAAGVLLAVLIMTLVAYFFTSISSWPEQEDDEKSSVQTSQFNLEYEVYDKKGMYGADVISCLTKAINNNEKYYEGENFLSGQRYGETYWVNVYVHLNSDLEEQMIVYHMEAEDNGIYKQVLQYGNKCEDYTLEEVGFKFDSKGNDYTMFRGNHKLKSALNKLSGASFIKCSQNVGDSNYYSILYAKKIDGSVDTHSYTPLQKLVATSDFNVRQIVTNNEDNKDSLEAWSSAEWRTALYDLKTRRFKCDDIKYSDVTGRVNEIYFSEI